MLQMIADDKHEGDLNLRPVWATLQKPKLSEVAELLERTTGTHHDEGMDLKLTGILRTMNWSEGPDWIDPTLVTRKNLFLNKDEHPWETEGLIRDNASQQGLHTCPDWVVPALVLHAERTDSNPVSFNLCLRSDLDGRGGFGMFFRKKWHIYKRSTDFTCEWSSPINWLMVKPKTTVEVQSIQV